MVSRLWAFLIERTQKFSTLLAERCFRMLWSIFETDFSSGFEFWVVVNYYVLQANKERVGN